MRTIAQVFNYLFHPIYLLFISIVLVVSLDPILGGLLPQRARFSLYGLLFINTVLLPITSLLILKKTGQISSIHLHNKDERRGPFFLILFYYGITYYLLRSNYFPVEILSILLASIVSLLLAFFITPKWKISAHGIGIGGLAGALFGFVSFGSQINIHFLSAAFLIGGIVCWARLKTDAHTLPQVVAGWVLGFIIEWQFVAHAIFI